MLAWVHHLPNQSMKRFDAGLVSLTGRPEFLNSAKSLTRPDTTHPASPRIFIRLAIMPPTAAQVWCLGWSITKIVPSLVTSAQWLPFGIALSSVSGRGVISLLILSMSDMVEAGAITLGWSAMANGDDGAYGTWRM